MKVKELFKRKRAWKKKDWPSTKEEVELLFALIDIKVISRVLRMVHLSKEQLLWCEEKMSKLVLSDNTLCRDVSPLPFPCWLMKISINCFFSGSLLRVSTIASYVQVDDVYCCSSLPLNCRYRMRSGSFLCPFAYQVQEIVGTACYLNLLSLIYSYGVRLHDPSPEYCIRGSFVLSFLIFKSSEPHVYCNNSIECTSHRQ